MQVEATIVIRGASQVLTCAARADDLVGQIDDGVVALAGDRIVAIGNAAEVALAVDLSSARVVDAHGGIVIPGFVDCHTHLVFADSRVAEYAGLLRGESSNSLRARGVAMGIRGTSQLLRQASSAQLVEQASGVVNKTS